MSETCKTCKFRSKEGPGLEGEPRCRRNPPQVHDGMSVHGWPRVDDDDWCGEWKPENGK